MLLVRALTAASVERLYILNPDPWHKTRHHKRRIVNADNLVEFARVLNPVVSYPEHRCAVSGRLDDYAHGE